MENLKSKLKTWGLIFGFVVGLGGFFEVALPWLKTTFEITSDIITTPENQRLIDERIQALEGEFRDTIEAMSQRQRELIEDLRSRQGSDHFAVGFRADHQGEKFVRWWDGLEYRLYTYEDSLLYFYDHQGHMIIPFMPHEIH